MDATPLFVGDFIFALSFTIIAVGCVLALWP